MTPVGEPGEHVDQRLARHDPVQARVLERDRGVGNERRGSSPLVEREPLAREGERSEALAPCGQRQLDARAALRERPDLDDLAAEADHDASGRAGCLDHGLHDRAQQLVDVVRRGQGLAEARGRVA